ncbi:MAG: hypothetical protein V1789_01710 [PVC group bacterium]
MKPGRRSVRKPAGFLSASFAAAAVGRRPRTMKAGMNRCRGLAMGLHG